MKKMSKKRQLELEYIAGLICTGIFVFMIAICLFTYMQLLSIDSNVTIAEALEDTDILAHRFLAGVFFWAFLLLVLGAYMGFFTWKGDQARKKWLQYYYKKKEKEEVERWEN